MFGQSIPEFRSNNNMSTKLECSVSVSTGVTRGHSSICRLWGEGIVMALFIIRRH